MTTADLIIRNATVYTMDEADTKASVIAVKDSRIIYVGNEDSDFLIGGNTKVIDANGKVVLPGLIDSHCHMLSMPALDGIVLDISMDLDTVLDEIRKYVAEHPEKDSYFGQVYLETCVTDEEYTKETLDKACPDKPLMLLGSTCHEEWVNTKALEVAGITKDTPDPLPGEHYFYRDENGEPTGRIVDFAPFEMIVNACKPCDNSSLLTGMVDFFKEYNSLGITCAAECGVLTPASEADSYSALDIMREKDSVTCRIAGSTVHTGLEPIETTLDHLEELHEKYHDDLIQIKTLKLLQDGCYEARTSSCYEPYLDSDFNRPPSFYGDELKDIFLKAAKSGFDIHVHALGDKSIFETLDAAGAVRKAGYQDTKITIAHCHSIRNQDLHLFKEYNVSANFTPQWFVVKQDIIDGIGKERHDDMLRPGSLTRMGVNITIGSDCPSDELGYEPWKGIEMSMTRQTYGQPDDEVMEDRNERLTLEEALRACTINGARQLGLENCIGSIEEGKYADMIILNADPYQTNVYDIHDLRPETTIFNGKVVYQKEV